MKVLITCGHGLLGSEIRKLDPRLIAPTAAELDITDPAAIEAAIKKYQPDVVLHLAAMTKPPEHEKDPIPGLQVNIIGSANVAIACQRANIKIVHNPNHHMYSGARPPPG